MGWGAVQGLPNSALLNIWRGFLRERASQLHLFHTWLLCPSVAGSCRARGLGHRLRTSMTQSMQQHELFSQVLSPALDLATSSSPGLGFGTDSQAGVSQLCHCSYLGQGPDLSFPVSHGEGRRGSGIEERFHVETVESLKPLEAAQIYLLWLLCPIASSSDQTLST